MTILASNLLLNQHLFSSTTAATVTTTTTTTVAAAAKIDYAKIFSIYSKKSQRGALSLSPSRWTQKFGGWNHLGHDTVGSKLYFPPPTAIKLCLIFPCWVLKQKIALKQCLFERKNNLLCFLWSSFPDNVLIRLVRFEPIRESVLHDHCAHTMDTAAMVATQIFIFIALQTTWRFKFCNP